MVEINSIRERIWNDYSKASFQQIALELSKDDRAFNEFLHLLQDTEKTVINRAAWILSFIFEINKSYIMDALPQLVKLIQETNATIALKRNILRILQFVNIPESLHDAVMQVSFDHLENRQMAVAVRCSSMTVLANLAKYYPEIKQEITAILHTDLHYGTSAGFRSRAKRILNELS